MPQPPNIVLIVGEDTGRIAGCYGQTYVSTPHLDRLAAEGCRYDEAYSTAPVCAPSRSALVTGRHQVHLGSHHMRSTLVDPPRLFTHELRDAGYHVSWPTKLDFNFEPPVTEAEIKAASLQFVRKICGFTKPSKPNEAAFELAVEQVATASRALLNSLETRAPAKNREEEAAKAKTRAALRFTPVSS